MNERLINEIAVGVVFVQGPGEELTMTDAEIIEAAAELQEGHLLLTDLEPDAQLSWSPDYKVVALNQPTFPNPPWRGMPRSFYYKEIDAALWRESNQKIYFFQDDQYIRLTGGDTDSGYPKPIAGNWHGLPADFETGIDAAFWRQSNDKIYMFKGSQYVRLTETEVDEGYPRPIAGNWHGLPADFEAGIDAAFMHGGNGKIYMFKGSQYVRLTGSTVDAGYPQPIKGNFKGVPDYFEERITTALWRGDNERVYLFSHGRLDNLNMYVRFTDITQNADDSDPLYVGGLDEEATEALWRDPALAELGMSGGVAGCSAYVDDLMQQHGADGGILVFVTKYPTYWPAYAKPGRIVVRWNPDADNFDRFFAHETGHKFGALDEYSAAKCDCDTLGGNFFRVANGNCALCAAALSMVDGSPDPIAGNWHGLPASFQADIDAAVWRDDTEHAYLFKGNQYVRLTGSTMDAGFPQPIAGNWHGLPASFEAGIDAALLRKSNGKLYLFKGSQYVRLTGSTVDAGFPQPIAGNWHGLPASFEAGIDAAMWRTSNGKIYFFKGSEYVRLTETTVDEGFPQPIAGNWEGLPASFTSGIDAALMHDGLEKLYLFSGNQYARMVNGVNCLMSNNSATVCSHTISHLGWGAFLTRIDAALYRGDNDKTYLFSGKWFVRYSSIGGGIDDGYPATIASHWHGLPSAFEHGIDAALWRPSNGKIYFFKGDQYVRLTGSTVDEGYPKPIAGNWHGIPASFAAGIDAALWRQSNDKIYLFKGDQYVRLTETEMDPGFPAPISSWDGLPESFSSGIDAALTRLDTNQIYFFRGRRYLRYSNVEDGPDAGYPAWIDKRWMPFPRG